MCPRLTILLLAVTPIVVLSGCGEDSSPDGSAAKPATGKAEFIKRANAICDREKEKALASTGSSEAEVIEDSILPAVQASIDGVRGIGPPPGEAERVESLLEAMQEDVDTVEEDGATTIGAFEAVLRQSGALARQYGLTSCAYG